MLKLAKMDSLARFFGATALDRKGFRRYCRPTHFLVRNEPSKQGCSDMRHGCVLFVGLFFGGCILESPTTGLWSRHHPFQGPCGSDVIQVDVAVLETPVADPILNQELWRLADEQGIAPEAQTVLDENGFRVGQIGGIAPKELQSLL